MAAALAGLTSAAAVACPPTARPHSAAYRDARGEDAEAPDIATVVVSDDGRLVTFRVWIPNRPRLTSDVGLQIVIDTDRRQATGNQSLVYSLGAEYLIQMLGGTARLLRWDRGSERWLPGSLQPSWSYDEGRAAIGVQAVALSNASDFLFEVSTASGLVGDTDGTIDITRAHFDFAPNVGHGGWRYRATWRSRGLTPTCAGLGAARLVVGAEAVGLERSPRLSGIATVRPLPSDSSRESVLVREDHCLHAVAQAELHEDALDVCLDRRLLDHERRGDLAVREPAGDELEDFELARGEVVQAVVS
jgi:hypothetical protein